jgi:transposase
MSEEEIRRAGVLKRVKQGEMKQTEAAAILSLSYRQVKRIYQRFLKSGAKGLVYGSAGKPSNRATPGKQKARILKLVRKHYSGGPGERFGPTLAAEHLEEDHGIAMDPETLRRWMLGEELWTRAKAQAIPATAGETIPFRRTGADGRQLRGVAGRAPPDL